jgi:hypothetical protein
MRFVSPPARISLFNTARQIKKGLEPQTLAGDLRKCCGMGVGPKGSTFFERLISQKYMEGKMLTKSVFLSKCLEMSTRLIIYPY